MRIFNFFLFVVVFCCLVSNKYAAYGEPLDLQKESQKISSSSLAIPLVNKIKGEDGAFSQHESSLYLKMQPYVVSIEVRAAESAYSSPGTTFGTGIILSSERGMILTNAHVAKTDSIVNHYDITLFNGKVCKAKLVYSDPWHDFAILEVDALMLKGLPQSLPTLRQGVEIGEPVLMIGKNENKHFSMQTGTVASIYEATSTLSSQCFRISLNAQGGASGSPVINTKGQVIGLIYAASPTSAFALPIDYALDAVDQLKTGQKPKRFATGAIFQLTSFEDLVRHDKLPQTVMSDQTQKFPSSFSRGITVIQTLPGTPAHGNLLPGDLIVKVNNQEIGPSLYKLGQILNDHGANHQKPATFEIRRHGKLIKKSIKLYDLNQFVIKKMIQFGKAIFFEINDELIQRTGAERGVFVANLKPGGSFAAVLPSLPTQRGYFKGLIGLTRINGVQIRTLDELEKEIPSLVQQQCFNITIRNYGTEFVFNDELAFAQQEQIKYISFYPSDGVPEKYIFNEDTKSWDLKVIGG